jgi:2-oxoglutarate/2-oxoacid ferredoxin oxidoreductase subunit beta
MPTLQDLATPHTPNWCPGCGNFTIWAAFKNSAVQQGWDNTNSVIVADIGCHSHIVNFTKMTSFEGLHGRALPTAAGVKMINHKLNVFVFCGDGGTLGEGGTHFLHACRRNHDLTVIMHNNSLYALTKGQTSSTSSHDYKSKSTPGGNPDDPLSPTTLAIAAGATFVARAYSSDIPNLISLITQATAHRGFALIDILQPCVTYQYECTHSYYQENVYPIGPEHDVTNRELAFQKSLEWGEKKIPVGIFYKVDEPPYEAFIPQIAEQSIVERPVVRRDISELLERYK